MSKQKIFISWSKPISKSIAEDIKSFLRQVHQQFDYFLSDENIPHGSFWSKSIGDNLKESVAGIICVTPENISSPWLNFEAEALFRSEKQRVYVLLFGVTVRDIESSPLREIQTTDFKKDSMLNMVQWINKELCSPLVDDDIVEKGFNQNWDLLEKNIIPKLESLKKKVGWIFSNKELEVVQENKLLEDEGYSILPSIIFSLDSTPELSKYDLLMFFHDGSDSDHSILLSVIDYLQSSYDSQVPLILYIEGRLPTDIFKQFTSYKKSDTANASGRIIDYCAKYLK